MSNVMSDDKFEPYNYNDVIYPGDEPKEDTAMAILSVCGWNAMHRTRACMRCHFGYLDLSISLAKIKGIAVLQKKFRHYKYFINRFNQASLSPVGRL